MNSKACLDDTINIVLTISYGPYDFQALIVYQNIKMWQISLNETKFLFGMLPSSFD